MNSLTYYLPQIILASLGIVVLIWGIFVVRDLIRNSHDKVTCLHCKKASEKKSSEPYLFLLPVSFGEKYENAEEYLPSHMRPIMAKQFIPTGRRACRLEVYHCSHCQKRQVTVTDFLLVRGEEDVKRIYELPYEPFQPLIERWLALRDQQIPTSN